MTKYWADYTDEQIDDLINNLVTEYRSIGFPFYEKLSKSECNELVKTLQKTDWNELIQDRIIKQTMHGLGAIWAYFPHAYSVKCGKSKSVMEVFESDDLFKKALRKRLKYGTTITDAGIRKALKTASGAQGVSNFRPSAAAAIYDFFNAETVYDMSGGYGGRLFGSIISKSVKSYTCVEPCKATYNGLLQIREDFNIDGKHINIVNMGSEDYIPDANSVDLCFTSPPYFNTEKYSEEPTQSYIKYPSYSEWINNFIGSTVDNCLIGLKNGGVLAYNVANTKSAPRLVEDIKQLVESKGLVYQYELKLTLSSIMAKGFKYEPVLVFKKS